MPLELQAKLLRVLQEKEVRPVGSNQRVKVDVRVIAATNRDLEAAYKNGTFRKDLYFRLNVVTVHVPALRERRSDIPMLVNWFCERYAPGADLRVSSAAMKALMNYEWPGNVRELENCVERAVALGNGTLIDLGDLPPSIAGIEFARVAASRRIRARLGFRSGRLGRSEFRRRRLSPLLSRPPTWKTLNAPPSSAFSSKSKATKPSPDACSASAAPLSTAN